MDQEIKDKIGKLFDSINFQDPEEAVKFLLYTSQLVGSLVAQLFTDRLHQADMLRTCVEAMEQAADRHNQRCRQKGQVQ